MVWSGNISVANELLGTRKFAECLELCLAGIADGKSSPVIVGTTVETEAFCVIAIQAYAELDRWQEVLPFVTQLYNGIEDCPFTIVKLCVLLHAYMRDYTTCNAVAHIWLRNAQNESCRSYSELVDIYMTQILIAQKKWKDVQPFLESCIGLSMVQKEEFQRQVRVIQNRLEEKEERERAEDDKEQREKLDAKSKEIKAPFPFDAVFGVYEWLARYVPKILLQFLARLTMLSLLIYWLISRGHLDFLSNTKLYNMLKSFMEMWKLLFAPFHLIRKS